MGRYAHVYIILISDILSTLWNIKIQVKYIVVLNIFQNIKCSMLCMFTNYIICLANTPGIVQRWKPLHWLGILQHILNNILKKSQCDGKGAIRRFHYVTPVRGNMLVLPGYDARISWYIRDSQKELQLSHFAHSKTIYYLGNFSWWYFRFRLKEPSLALT